MEQHFILILSLALLNFTIIALYFLLMKTSFQTRFNIIFYFYHLILRFLDFKVDCLECYFAFFFFIIS